MSSVELINVNLRCMIWNAKTSIIIFIQMAYFLFTFPVLELNSSLHFVQEFSILGSEFHR
jgi:uncharacterized membrane protein (DUF106 family)